MRLIDEILAASPAQDRSCYGMLSAVGALIRDGNPQCYEISDEVYHACLSVYTSRPSSVLSAFSYARLPYDCIWLERAFKPDRGKDGLQDVNPDKPAPRRVGCVLVHAKGSMKPGSPPYSCAVATWAWSFHDGTVVVCPFEIFFDWHNEIEGQIGLTEREIGDIRANKGARWHDYISDSKEVAAAQKLTRHNALIPFPAAYLFWKACGIPCVGGTVPDMPPYMIDVSRITSKHKETLGSLINDLAGEDALVTGFLLMLNSRNALAREPEDLTRLNRARVKRDKPPLKEFVKTSLFLPGHLKRAFGMSAGERATARMHMVSGHYKTRKSGVFWWSPHPRNKGREPVQRQQYDVKLKD